MDSVTYFVGAGLTKSLALCSKPIPAMRDFIYVAAEYLYDDVVLTTLADLELCDPYTYAWQSDQARELARKLTDGSRRTSQMRSDFARALRARPAESIEDVLDSTSETSSNFSSQTANLQFQYGINRLFGLVGWNLNWDPLRLFLAHQLRSHVAHNFVSFNYDIVFDHAIES